MLISNAGFVPATLNGWMKMGKNAELSHNCFNNDCGFCGKKGCGCDCHKDKIKQEAV